MELSERGRIRAERWKMQSNRKPYMNPYKIMILQPGVSEEIKFSTGGAVFCSPEQPVLFFMIHLKK